MQPSTELERTVAAILAGSENVEKEDQELTEAEKKSLLMMTVEEVYSVKGTRCDVASLVWNEYSFFL